MVGWEKQLFIINLTKVTYNGDIGHCSSNLVLGFSSTMHQPLPHMLLLTKWLQKIGARGIKKGQSFFAINLCLSNGTPTYYFIG